MNKREITSIDLWCHVIFVVRKRNLEIISIIWAFSQNYHQPPWYPCSYLKVGIKWSFSQNYHQPPWYPCFNLKVGIIWSFSLNYHQPPWYPCFNGFMDKTWIFAKYSQTPSEFPMPAYRAEKATHRPYGSASYAIGKKCHPVHLLVDFIGLTWVVKFWVFHCLPT